MEDGRRDPRLGFFLLQLKTAAGDPETRRGCGAWSGLEWKLTGFLCGCKLQLGRQSTEKEGFEGYAPFLALNGFGKGGVSCSPEHITAAVNEERPSNTPEQRICVIITRRHPEYIQLLITCVII